MARGVDHDLIIAGGGINGCAIAREATLHGLSVLLLERDRLAAHTSSKSSKLIHGGLRYLEFYDFKLVREALQERERLLRLAPGLVRPVPFVLPHAHAPRPVWMVRAGLWLYDTIGGRSSVPRARRLRARDTAYQAPFAQTMRGFVYYDAMVDDAALTRAYADDAIANGAQVREGVALGAATRTSAGWQMTLSDGTTQTARMLVNAAGPWVAELLDTLAIARQAGVRLVKGSHITVPRLYDGDHAYLLQQPDRRVVFAFPWEGETAIGTTDVAVDTPADPAISAEETAYLCAAADRYFRRQLSPADVTGSWSGVRALYDDGAGAAQAVTRDYVLELEEAGGAPLLSVFGGKITTARALAEDVLSRLGYTTPVSRDRPIG